MKYSKVKLKQDQGDLNAKPECFIYKTSLRGQAQLYCIEEL